MSRGTQAIINFDKLRYNFNVLSKLAPSKLVLVVKADAYGHGLKQIVQALDDAECFAVATIDEALTVRKIRVDVKIVLLEGFLSRDELEIAVENNFDCVIHQQQQLDMLGDLDSSMKLNIWLKHDSGMNRLGFNSHEFSTALTSLEKSPKVNELILMSHLASANQKDNPFTKQQADSFIKLVGNQQVSLSNTSALLNKKYLKGEWCRVGISLFGVSPVEGTIAKDFGLKPVMKLKTNVIATKTIKAGETIGYGQTYTTSKDMKIAIIGIGYGDGYPWSLSDDACAVLNNKKAKIIGRVSMDMIAVDISGINNVSIGDSVLIWGEDGNSKLPLENVAQNANTIPYVLLCQITSRVKYNYV